MVQAPSAIIDCLERIKAAKIDPFDFLPRRTFLEKAIDLELLGAPNAPGALVPLLDELRERLSSTDTSQVSVVVFGGGTGLSTVVGGDSRQPNWAANPFQGLKQIFPCTQAIVCVTDDGGSTGELLKDLPMIGLGDLRHVLLSSIRGGMLQARYSLSHQDALRLVRQLAAIFNHRFISRPSAPEVLIDECGLDAQGWPPPLQAALYSLIKRLFSDLRLSCTLERAHCLGNLLIASAIYEHVPVDQGNRPGAAAVRKGINYIGALIGANEDAVLPCTITPSMLRIEYGNGVIIAGESKSSTAQRKSPVKNVFTEFCGQPEVLPEVLETIATADILIFAPGSLYTSLVPVFQTPGLSEAVRQNSSALKMLVANLWVQKGETDLAVDEPNRKFYVSDLIQAYHRNIPGGLQDFFQHILLLGLQDIPGHILQSYAVEGKVPIYFDPDKVCKLGFIPVESSIYSRSSLQNRNVKHDPQMLARAVRTIWAVQGWERKPSSVQPLPVQAERTYHLTAASTQTERYAVMKNRLNDLEIAHDARMLDYLWKHKDILPKHLEYFDGLRVIPVDQWSRCQAWDNVFSFYDPQDRMIKIRQDAYDDDNQFEVAFLLALGQSLLGNYIAVKELGPVKIDGNTLGKVFSLRLRPEEQRWCFFSTPEIVHYLKLARFRQHEKDPFLFTRLLNGEDGFTPPGMLFGLTYLWYLDNRFASHIEYKMAISSMQITNLVPEQIHTLKRRRDLIQFFRQSVFQCQCSTGKATS